MNRTTEFEEIPINKCALGMKLSMREKHNGRYPTYGWKKNVMGQDLRSFLKRFPLCPHGTFWPV